MSDNAQSSTSRFDLWVYWEQLSYAFLHRVCMLEVPPGGQRDDIFGAHKWNMHALLATGKVDFFV